jgi:secreted trypsin-like serine protease
MRRAKLFAVIGLACVGTVGSAAKADAAPVAGASISHGGFASPEWGFSAAVYEDGRFICSGSVVSPTAVLTARHCLSSSPARLAVRTGSNFIWGGGQYIGVSAFAASAGTVDIGILRLASPTAAPPIKVATPEEDAAYLYPGVTMSIAGFGNREPNSWRKQRFGTLMATDVRMSTRCRYITRQFFPASEACAIGKRRFPLQTTSNTCTGDSGGPMAVYFPDGPRLFGVASKILTRRHLGFRCGDIAGASIYERVGFSYSFIQANSGP